MAWRPESPARPVDDHSIVVEMCGANIVVRAPARIDRASTCSLVDMINAAGDANTCVVIDPESIRCDDAFAGHEVVDVVDRGSARPPGRPAGADVAITGIVRLRAEGSVWLIDVGAGRFCRTDTDVDPRFVPDDAWRPIVALSVTPTRLVALGVGGELTSARRAQLTPAL